MPVIYGKAPGKIILFGEHAVVYGQPAIAIPVTKVNATARVIPNLEPQGSTIRIQAPDIQLEADLSDLPEEHPIAAAIRLILEAVAPKNIPALTINFSSTIPVSAGMGSSAAVSIAIIRALSAFFGKPLSPSEVSDLAYQVEKIHHGTPSGIDNNVIAHQQPVYFVRDNPIQFLEIQNSTHWVIADTGEKTPTRETVAAVRALHTENPDPYDQIFSQIGGLTQQAREALPSGDMVTLGALMNENQRLLEQLNVSSEKLDSLINAALAAGAAGAKLSGGGRGGNMIALAVVDSVEAIERALIDAGANQTITTLLAERRQG
jgi:mevalonate kinase